MVGIFDGMDNLVDKCLGVSAFGESQTPSHRLFVTLLALTARPFNFNGNLTDELFARATSNWEGTPAMLRGRSSLQNWRATKLASPLSQLHSPTTFLNQAIAAATGDQLANRVPVDSGLLGSTGRRKVALAEHRGTTGSLIELATTANTPLAMAIQGLQNCIVYLFFRSRITQVGHPDWGSHGLPKLLKAEHISLAVLAPRSFYVRFERTLDWLAEFETTLNRDLLQADIFRETRVPVAFQFETFPDDFDWAASMGESSTGRADVLAAFTNRYRLFAA